LDPVHKPVLGHAVEKQSARSTMGVIKAQRTKLGAVTAPAAAFIEPFRR
jgi:hypothetical protein